MNATDAGNVDATGPNETRECVNVSARDDRKHGFCPNDRRKQVQSYIEKAGCMRRVFGEGTRPSLVAVVVGVCPLRHGRTPAGGSSGRGRCVTVVVCFILISMGAMIQGMTVELTSRSTPFVAVVVVK